MKLVITISMDGAAFETLPAEEVHRILRNLTLKILTDPRQATGLQRPRFTKKQNHKALSAARPSKTTNVAAVAHVGTQR